MAKIPIRIGDRVFRTKSELQGTVREIVARYDDGERLDEPDFSFVLLLLDRHPSAEIKIGAGVESIEVRRNPVYRNTRGFYLNRIDGTGTDFSWVECINPTPHRKKVVRAMRALVEPQTMEFKQRFFADNGATPCPITGEWITLSNSHVDHVPPRTFDVLVERFCRESDVDLESEPLHGEFDDNKYADELADTEVVQAWVEFHRSNAVLRVISPLANLSHSRIENRLLKDNADERT